jgi:hypothetical protein
MLMSVPPPPLPHTRYSDDGFWWWDGASWKPAVSADRLWRWNGQTWVPAQQTAAAQGRGPGGAILVSVAVFFGVLVLVSIIATLVFLSMSDQIANVFTNVFGTTSG